MSNNIKTKFSLSDVEYEVVDLALVTERVVEVGVVQRDAAPDYVAVDDLFVLFKERLFAAVQLHDGH